MCRCAPSSRTASSAMWRPCTSRRTARCTRRRCSPGPQRPVPRRLLRLRLRLRLRRLRRLSSRVPAEAARREQARAAVLTRACTPACRRRRRLRRPRLCRRLRRRGRRGSCGTAAAPASTPRCVSARCLRSSPKRGRPLALPAQPTPWSRRPTHRRAAATPLSPLRPPGNMTGRGRRRQARSERLRHRSIRSPGATSARNSFNCWWTRSRGAGGARRQRLISLTSTNPKGSMPGPWPCLGRSARRAPLQLSRRRGRSRRQW
mmetsp:Transcript_16935/g.59164  ORF Transcript_16935/g.59164 Transcript_16935/m.59164 type:complete len:261 (-) Transcript_16935:1530-2312(-)